MTSSSTQRFISNIKTKSILYVFRKQILALFGCFFFWSYCNKFFTYSADYVGDMSRDITIEGVQQNIAYYSIESLTLFLGGFLLISYLLIQNEFSNLFDEPRQFDSIKSPLNVFTDLLQNMYLWVVLFGVVGVFESSSSFSSLTVITLLSGLVKGISLGLFCGLFFSAEAFLNTKTKRNNLKIRNTFTCSESNLMNLNTVELLSASPMTWNISSHLHNC